MILFVARTFCVYVKHHWDSYTTYFIIHVSDVEIIACDVCPNLDLGNMIYFFDGVVHDKHFVVDSS